MCLGTILEMSTMFSIINIDYALLFLKRLVFSIRQMKANITKMMMIRIKFEEILSVMFQERPINSIAIPEAISSRTHIVR
jgi:hypothetical protein